ncbi:response regulator [Flavobacterium facile]|jgi:DNA-binding NtrC family response regulator|uniref:response regulator n=1 Tax=Flavobacterium facile TaxID=2893174 RepID=UPI002E78FC5C|nr:response regulator [Flavobacterium sp. T-12]
MTNQTQNLFIVEDNPENALKLHQFLDTRFGTVFNISTFTDAVTALSKVDENTSVVVLDYDYFGVEGNKIVEFIKNINKKTKVIILSNNEEIFTAIDSHRNEADNYLLKEKGVKKKLSTTLFEIVTYPANYLQMKYSVSQFFVYLVFLFIVVGFLVFIGMISI